jgi:hypothetical protein
MGSQGKDRKLVAVETISRWLFIEHKAFLFNMIRRGECCNALMDMYDVIFATLFVTH